MNNKVPGYYWIVFKGLAHVAYWTGRSFSIPDDPHRYFVDELDAFIPFPLHMDHTQKVYVQQLMDFNQNQLNYLWNYWEETRVKPFDVNDINAILRILEKIEGHAEDPRHP